nr:DMT family transporter [Oceanococcus sp. HetDA_MAG_MS8]
MMNWRLIFAYAGVVFVWSTTPLMVKLSTHSLSVPAATGLRMLLACFISMSLLAYLRQALPLDRRSLASYAAANLGMFGSLSLTYQAVQTIPTGLVSVIFGLAPVLSGTFAHFILHERNLTPMRALALLLAIAGLGLVFEGALEVDPSAWPGLILALVATALFALGSVLVKAWARHLDPVQHTTGSLILSLPLFFASWLLLDRTLPSQLSATSVGATVYLAIIGSVLAFVLYFQVLRHTTAVQAALIPVMTPVLALYWGHWLLNEEPPASALYGAMLILLGLSLYQFGAQLRQWLVTRRAS